MNIRYFLILIFTVFISSLCEAKLTFMGMRGSSSNQTVTLTGDVTGSGIGSIVTTISASSVSLGTDTAGILPTTQGGWGTDTTGTIGVVAGKIGIGTTTPATKLHVIGTITASTGFSGSGAGLTDLVKQVSGTSTQMTADNIAIVGTNSTATFKDVTVTGTFESGSQWTTTGTWSVATGINQDQTHYVSGSGTVEIVSSVSGATTTVNLIYVPQVWAVGSSSVTGTTEGTLTTIVLPAGDKLGTLGFLEIVPYFSVATSTTTNKTFKCYISDGNGTSTLLNLTASYVWLTPYIIVRNQGSSSVNVASSNSTTAWFSQGSTALFPNDTGLNTRNTLYVSFTASFATATTIPATLTHAFVRATYVP